MTLRVLQLVSTGDATFFEQQIEGLERQGVSTTVLGLPPTREMDGKSVSPRSPVDYLRFYADVLAESAFGTYDLVHANYGLVGALALAQPTRPVVVTLWGSELMGDDRWLTIASRTTACRADSAIVPSEAMSAYLPCSHEVVPFAVDTDLFRPLPRSEARERLGWETDRFVVLFPGTQSREVKNYPRAEAIVGSLDVDAILLAFDGTVPHEEVPYYMNASDAVLITSDHEAGPMVLKEAAACNVPVVSTDVGFARDVLSDVSNSAVCRSDAELRRELGTVLRSDGRSDGRDAIVEDGIDRLGERLLAIYRDVLDHSGREGDPRTLDPSAGAVRQGGQPNG